MISSAISECQLTVWQDGYEVTFDNIMNVSWQLQ